MHVLRHVFFLQRLEFASVLNGQGVSDSGCDMPGLVVIKHDLKQRTRGERTEVALLLPHPTLYKRGENRSSTSSHDRRGGKTSIGAAL